jgi:hypothetical protein
LADIHSPRWPYAKGALFLLPRILASGIRFLEHPSLKAALLLSLAVWSFARAYYAEEIEDGAREPLPRVELIP